jgi:DNA polymerase III delta prime subunit
MTLTWPEPDPPPAGNLDRFGGRWRLVGAGLSNVWRFGDLELDAPSGRLLLRGPNGTGKTTALEALWPYLLDLNAARLAAGKARNTHLSNLMREAADGRRRVGYVWLSFASPGNGAGVVSYGVRLNFSEGGTPPVRVTPFTVPGRPLHDLALWGVGRATLSAEQFAEAVAQQGGTTFDEPDQYVRDLATRLFVSERADVALLAQRIREVRNPAWLGELSPREAADALRASLPGVADDEIEAAGEALAESDATRQAFEADREAAAVLDAFARAWTGHVVDVTVALHDRARQAVDDVERADASCRRAKQDSAAAARDADVAGQLAGGLAAEQDQMRGRLEAIEHSAEYRAAGRLGELEVAASSSAGAATATWTTLAEVAARAAQQTGTDLDRLDDLRADVALVVDEVVPVAPFAGGVEVLTWSVDERPPYRVADRVADAGPALRAQVDAAAFGGLVRTLEERADERSRQADRARTFVTAHEAVAAAEGEARRASDEADRLARTADEVAKRAKEADAAAGHQATVLADDLRAWRAGLDDDPGFDLADLADVDWSEPAVALDAADGFAEASATWAHGTASDARARATRRDEEARDLRRDASALRVEAERIRTEDLLLPLPRPDWAGEGDDARALGTAVDWADDVPGTVQDVVEATLAAAGVLGATLDAAGARTDAWTVAATGPIADRNLGAVLGVDPEHSLADVATGVLARITFVPTAADATHDGLVIGADGTFRAGVLAASVAAAQDEDRREPARHVGARRRREAALAHAARLDTQADDLDEQAQSLEDAARSERALAETVLHILAGFPRRDRLRDAESARVAAALARRAADEVAGEAADRAGQLTDRAREERRRWEEVVVGAGLVADVVQLEDLVTMAKSDAGQLRRAAGQLERFRPRLERLVEDVVRHDASEMLDARHATAQQAHTEAEAARARYQELLSQVGKTAEEVLNRHQEVKARLTDLGVKLRAAEKESRSADTKAAELKVRAEEAEARLRGAKPLAATAVAALREVLTVPGVVEAILDGDALAQADDALLAQVGGALRGKPTVAKRTLRERADETRASLAGVWSIDPGVDHPELETYLLTHGTTSFTPLGAMGHARLLAERAEAALRAADEAALRDFVVGRLPAAVSQAWTRLFDWVGEVNRKMRSASASSGVGVAVHIGVRADLPPLVRYVYEHTCKTGEALRDPTARAEVGRVLQELIEAADGEDMTARVREAVDVRDWVDVTYQVIRPGEEQPRNWGSRTGLSGGERRLVVLAPMLAAVAAAYDRFPSDGVRLVALDEVPSEVDQEGREGLARYIAELDLDLVATSHHWDGAPGAWDGIDAHDLESGPDGTVVAFPMLVRGLHALPDDHLGPHELPPV